MIWKHSKILKLLNKISKQITTSETSFLLTSAPARIDKIFLPPEDSYTTQFNNQPSSDQYFETLKFQSISIWLKKEGNSTMQQIYQGLSKPKDRG